MHSVPITIPGEPHNFILTYIHYSYYLGSFIFGNNDGSRTANPARSMPCNLIKNSCFGNVWIAWLCNKTALLWKNKFIIESARSSYSPWHDSYSQGCMRQRPRHVPSLSEMTIWSLMGRTFLHGPVGSTDPNLSSDTSTLSHRPRNWGKNGFSNVFGNALLEMKKCVLYCVWKYFGRNKKMYSILCLEMLW